MSEKADKSKKRHRGARGGNPWRASRPQLEGWRRRSQNQSRRQLNHRERAAEPSAAAGPSVHRRNALPGKLHPRTSPGAGRHLEGARDVKKTKITIAGEFCVTRHVIIRLLTYTDLPG